MLFISCDSNNESKDSDMDSTINDTEERDSNNLPDSIDETTDKFSETESDDSDTILPSYEIIPGESIAGIKPGMRYSEVIDLMGKEGNSMGFNHMTVIAYADEGIEIFVASEEPSKAGPNDLVLGIGAVKKANFTGPIEPGMTVEELDKAIDKKFESTPPYRFYPFGMSIEIDEGAVKRIGIFEPYEIAYEPPPMEKCEPKAKAGRK